MGRPAPAGRAALARPPPPPPPPTARGRAGGGRARDRTDDQGAFRIEGLRPSRYELTVFANGQCQRDIVEPGNLPVRIVI